MALFGGRVSKFFGSPKSFRFGNLRGAHCRHLWVSNARYRDFCGWSEGRTARQLETQQPGSKWPFLGVEFPGFSGLRKVSDLEIFAGRNAAISWSRIDGAWIFWMKRGGSSPPAGNSVTRKQMALFWGRVSRFLGPPKSFRFENLRGVRRRHLWVSEERRRGFLDGARRELPSSWKLRNQEANGPFWGSSFQVFRATKKFQI